MQQSEITNDEMDLLTSTEFSSSKEDDSSRVPLHHNMVQQGGLSHSQQTVIAYSNHGVQFIENGRYDAAITTLSFALNVCRRIMHEAEDCSAPIHTSIDACMEEYRNTSNSAVHSSTQGGRYLYQQPVRIPLNVGANYRACVMISTMVTFNLALANQLASTRNKVCAAQESSQVMLRKAAKLYELAFRMQQEEDLEGNTLFTLATVNNLGLVHSHLYDGIAANKCFEYLLSTLMCLTDCGVTNASSAGVGAQLDGFFRNASTLNDKSDSAPAA